MTKGMIKNGDKVELAVNASEERLPVQEPQCNPSASEGSAYGAWFPRGTGRLPMWTQDRLRLTFSHFSAMTPEELDKGWKRLSIRKSQPIFPYRPLS